MCDVYLALDQLALRALVFLVQILYLYFSIVVTLDYHNWCLRVNSCGRKADAVSK